MRASVPRGRGCSPSACLVRPCGCPPRAPSPPRASTSAVQSRRSGCSSRTARRRRRGSRSDRGADRRGVVASRRCASRSPTSTASAGSRTSRSRRARRPAGASRFASTSSRSTAFSASSSRARWACRRVCCAAPSSIVTAPRRRSDASTRSSGRSSSCTRTRVICARRSRRRREIQHDPDRALLTFDHRCRAARRHRAGRHRARPARLAPGLPAPAGRRAGDVFLRPRIQERLDNYVQRLKDRRFYEAEGSLQSVAVGGWPDRRPGHRHHLGVAGDGTVRFSGGEPWPPDRLKELAPIEREGSVDEDLLEDSEARIENYLRQQGYWKADVTRSARGDRRGADDRLHGRSAGGSIASRRRPRSPARRPCRWRSWPHSSR